MRKDGLRLSLALGVALLLAACGSAGDGGGGGGGDGGDGGGDGGGGAVVRLGFVDFSEYVDKTFADDLRDVDIEASFVATSEDIADALAAAGPDVPVGTCVVGDLDDDADFELPEIPGGLTGTFTSLDAGASLEVLDGDAVYVTAEKFEIPVGGDTFFAYDGTVDEENSAPAPPAGLVLDVPGSADGFPAASVELPHVAAMNLTSPARTGAVLFSLPVGPTTAFAWDAPASGDPESIVELFVAPADLLTGGTIYVACSAPDDGGFEFPAATQAELGVGYAGVLWDFKRVARQQVDVGADAAVLLKVERGIGTVSLGF